MAATAATGSSRAERGWSECLTASVESTSDHYLVSPSLLASQLHQVCVCVF